MSTANIFYCCREWDTLTKRKRERKTRDSFFEKISETDHHASCQTRRIMSQCPMKNVTFIANHLFQSVSEIMTKKERLVATNNASICRTKMDRAVKQRCLKAKNSFCHAKANKKIDHRFHERSYENNGSIFININRSGEREEKSLVAYGDRKKHLTQKTRFSLGTLGFVYIRLIHFVALIPGRHGWNLLRQRIYNAIASPTCILFSLRGQE